MPDIRESILVRIKDILEIMAPERTLRNTDEITSRGGLAAILFDGDEGIDEDSEVPKSAMGDPRVLQDYMIMSPAIELIKGSETEDIGTDLNLYRKQLLPLIINDAALVSLVGRNGQIRYMGCSIETQAGENRSGTITFDFRIRYVLRVSDLTE
jgi:hypothetical protein